MNHIKLFEGFLNEHGRRGSAVATLENAQTILRKIYGNWEKGEYSHDTNYSYGGLYKFEDGTTEKGYTSTHMTLTITKKGIAMHFMPDSAKKELETLFPPAAIEKISSLHKVNLTITTYSMITSKRDESKVYLSLGPTLSSKIQGNTLYQLITNETIDEVANKVKAEIAEVSKKFTGADLVRAGFESYAYSLLPKLKNVQSSQSRDVGIGSAASTRVSHDIKRGYDVKAYVKKYGEESLKKAIKGTWFEKRTFKGLEDGVLMTDESWTDVYD